MVIPTRSLILLAFAALIQSQVLEVDFAIDANNRIVSMSKTIRSDIKAVITSALNTTVFTGLLNTTRFSGNFQRPKLHWNYTEQYSLH